MTIAPPPTKPGTTKLSELARKVVAPSGITSTGWPAVRDTCVRKLGIAFDPWQDAAGRLILAKRADGKLACMIGGVGMSLPRQVGKTYLLAAIIFALCILRPGLLVIWSAHHARTHGETFLAMQAFANRSKIKPYIQDVFKGSGDEEIRFRNGSRILFGARERGFGRGIPGVDVIVSDEAQIMTDKALDAQLATMNVSHFGLAVFVGTPPRPEDPSEAFSRMRAEAWAGTLQDAIWIEFGADPGADIHDRKQWAKGNPSYPLRTPTESILRLLRKLAPESFLREGLGIWDDDVASGAFPASAWSDSFQKASKIDRWHTFAVDVTPDRSRTAIATAGLRKDGRFHIEYIQQPGTSKAAARIAELLSKWGGEVTLDPSSPAGSLIPALEELGIEPRLVTTREYAQACAAIYDDVVNDRIRHIGQPELNEAVAGAVRKNSGDAAWHFSRRNTLVNIAPLVACTLAAATLRSRTDYDVLDSVF